NAELLAVSDQLGVHAGGDDELRACCDSFVNLGGGEHGARADEHLREIVAHQLDSGGSACRTERNLGNRYTAGDQGLRQRDRVTLRVIELDDRYDTDGLNLFLNFIHCDLPPCFILWNAVS